MAKKKQKIKPEAAERLKTLLKEQDISQSSLANVTGISQNTISRIMNQKAPLTYSVASLIHEKFPEYRTEWIMGKDNDRTEEYHKLRPLTEELLYNQARRKAIDQLFLYMGLECVMDLPEVEGSNTPLAELSEEERDNIFRELIPAAAQNDFALKICNSEGKVLARISRQEFQSFTEEISDFFEFKVNKLCQR